MSRNRCAARLGTGALAVMVTACGSSTAPTNPTPILETTIPSTAHYLDPRYRFGFSYPANWHVGRPSQAGEYRLTIAIPRSPAHVRITVNRVRLALSLPALSTARRSRTHTGHRVRVAGRTAVETEILVPAGPRGITTRVNGARHGYSVTVVTPRPPLESRTIDGYRQIIRSLQIS
jgi:hypothetical protein